MTLWPYSPRQETSLTFSVSSSSVALTDSGVARGISSVAHRAFDMSFPGVDPKKDADAVLEVRRRCLAAEKLLANRRSPPQRSG
jgi:hypothetical protein